MFVRGLKVWPNENSKMRIRNCKWNDQTNGGRLVQNKSRIKFFTCTKSGVKLSQKPFLLWLSGSWLGLFFDPHGDTISQCFRPHLFSATLVSTWGSALSRQPSALPYSWQRRRTHLLNKETWTLWSRCWICAKGKDSKKIQYYSHGQTKRASIIIPSFVQPKNYPQRYGLRKKDPCFSG